MKFFSGKYPLIISLGGKCRDKQYQKRSIKYAKYVKKSLFRVTLVTKVQTGKPQMK